MSNLSMALFGRGVGCGVHDRRSINGVKVENLFAFQYEVSCMKESLGTVDAMPLKILGHFTVE